MITLEQYINEEPINEKCFETNDYSKHNFKYPIAVLQDILQNKDIKLGPTGNNGLLDYSKINIKDIENLLKSIDISTSDTFNSIFNSKIWTKIYKSPYSKVEGKNQFERQERGIVQAINDTLKDNPGPINISFNYNNIKNILYNVTSANKVEGLNSFKKEPYADIEIKTRQKTYKISCKDFKETPSSIGGGLLGMFNICPEYIKTSLLSALDKVKDTENFKNNIWKDIYIKLDRNVVIDLFRGNSAMGGPVDYIYKGTMKVSYWYDSVTKMLNIDGSLLNAYTYANKYANTLYIRVRRREENSINTTLTDKNGIPYFTLKKDGKSNNRRICITNKKG